MFMFSTKKLKLQAKNNLEGKYFKYFLIMLVTTLLSSIPVFFDPEGTSIFFNIINLVLSSIIALFLYRISRTPPAQRSSWGMNAKIYELIQN